VSLGEERLTWGAAGASCHVSESPTTREKIMSEIQETGRRVHALAALRDAGGSIPDAARVLGISEQLLVSTVSSMGSNFSTVNPDGSVHLTDMALRFAAQKDTFPSVSW
jgi:hypothetical protein